MTPVPLTNFPCLARPGLPVRLAPLLRTIYGKATGIVFDATRTEAWVTYVEDCRPLRLTVADLLIDPTDPLVRACMLQLLRERWELPLATAVYSDDFEWWVLDCGLTTPMGLSMMHAPTEAELLLAALAVPR